MTASAASAASASNNNKKKKTSKSASKRKSDKKLTYPTYIARIVRSPIHPQLRAQLGNLGAVSSRTVKGIDSALRNHLQDVIQTRIEEARESSGRETVDLALAMAATSRLWANRDTRCAMKTWARARVDAYRASVADTKKKPADDDDDDE